MKLTVSGDNLAESFGLLAGMVPTPLVHITFGMGYARSVVAATRLGVFDAIAKDDADAAGLAERLECSPVGMEALLNCLTGFGLLARDQGRYTCTPVVTKWVLEDAENSMKAAVLFLGYCQEMLWGLEDAIRTGEIERLHDRDLSPEFWDAYMRALASFARLLGKEIVRRVDVTEGVLLDVGGGHGLYAAAFVQRAKGALRAEVLDLPGACEVGRRIIAAEGLSETVVHREGDFREDDWGEGYDTVFVCNVLHNATEAESRTLMAKAHAALKPKGQLIVCDAGHTDTVDASAGWNELFFFLVSGAKAWPEQTLSRWMVEAGFEEPTRKRLFSAPNVLLISRRC